ncbi:Unknown protein sequence [Pseudomonas syringae pv. maculicola]|nr:Unknown protein sequence [Pseudomonas syringae pv. maculicola]
MHPCTPVNSRLFIEQDPNIICGYTLGNRFISILIQTFNYMDNALLVIFPSDIHLNLLGLFEWLMDGLLGLDSGYLIAHICIFAVSHGVFPVTAR